MEKISLVCLTSSLMGAICQEVMHWNQLRTKLADDKYNRLIISKAYWVITVLTIIISPVGVWELYGDKNLTKDIYFILGASFPLVFKKLVTSITDKDGRVTLGDRIIYSYFDIS